MGLNIIMSIKPKYVREIIEGKKKYEYRKSIFKNDIDRIYIYSSSPVKKIVGYFKFKGYLKDTPSNIWNETQDYAGIDKKSYDKYFDGKELAYALNIYNFHEFEEYIDPKIIFDNFTAPQSYKYIYDII